MKTRDLTKGSIIKDIALVAIPLILSSAINMLYNFTDMFWISSVGPEAVSSVGTTALFLWLSAAIIMIVNLGTQIEISYAAGRHDKNGVSNIILNGLKYSAIVGIAVGIIFLIFAPNLIGFFKVENAQTNEWAINYLRICSVFIVFSSLNQTFSSIYNGLGNSKLVLYFMGIGMVANIFLDPLFIKVFNLGVEGAAIATMLSAIITFVLFTISMKNHLNLSVIKAHKFEFEFVKTVTKLGLFPTVQNILFASIAMVLTRIISSFGDQAIAISRVGNDIEALTWMVGVGISTAIAVFVGQNVAAGKQERAKHASKIMIVIMGVYGLIISSFFVLGADLIFAIFFDQPLLIELGHNYLIIAAFSQVFVIWEQVVTGILNGYKKTNIAPVFSISGNLLRIPLALILSSLIGLNGIWIAIGISSIYKCVGLMIGYLYISKKQLNI